MAFQEKFLKQFVLSFILLLCAASLSLGADENQPVPFTLADRDRIVRLEEGQKSLQLQIDQRFAGVDQRFAAMDQRFTALDRRIDELHDFMLWGFGVTFAGMFSLIGFVLWDRRTALAPAIRRQKELAEQEELIKRALQEYAKVEPRLAEILRTLRFM